MSRLIIVGNGFDLAHDVPSAYSDFREYLIRNNYPLYSLIVELSDQNVWNNFEESLANLDLERLIDRLLDENISHENYRPNDSVNWYGVRAIERKLDETGRLLICELENELVEWATTIKDFAQHPKFKLLRRIT